MRRLRILVLMHAELVPPDSLEGLPEEEWNRWKMEFDVLAGLESLGHEVIGLGVEDDLRVIRNAIEAHQPHLVFNLLMHFHDAGVYDSAVVSYLELLRVPYTGCNPRGLLLAGDKALSKKVLAYHRINAPRFALWRRGKQVQRLPSRLRFPLIVKSASEHASTGISQASIVRDLDQLAERVAFVHRSVGTDAIAEEYIEGREVTISVLGNERLTVFPPWELSFDSLPRGAQPIATARVKWDRKYQRKVGVHTGRAEDLGPELEQRLPRLARRIFRALDLSGYARIDLRIDAEGRPWVLEANPNPDLCFGEDYAESAETTGIPYASLLQRICGLGLGYRAPWKG